MADRFIIVTYVQEWRDHLDMQLDGLTGKLVCGKPRVLSGHHHRLEGGEPIFSWACRSCRSEVLLCLNLGYFLCIAAFVRGW